MALAVSVSPVCPGCSPGSGLFPAVGDGEASSPFLCLGKVLVALIAGSAGQSLGWGVFPSIYLPPSLTPHGAGVLGREVSSS